MFLLLVTMFCQLLFCSGHVETNKYFVDIYDNEVNNSQLLKDSEGSLYLFFIRDGKLIIEKKLKQSDFFVRLEQQYLKSNFKAISMDSFELPNSETCILLKGEYGFKGSLLLIRVNDNDIVFIENIDTLSNGLIYNINVYPISQEEIIITYLKDNKFNSSYLNGSEVTHAVYDFGNIVEYKIEGAIVEDKFTYIGHLLKDNGVLSYLKYDGATFIDYYLGEITLKDNQSFVSYISSSDSYIVKMLEHDQVTDFNLNLTNNSVSKNVSTVFNYGVKRTDPIVTNLSNQLGVGSEDVHDYSNFVYNYNSFVCFVTKYQDMYKVYILKYQDGQYAELFSKIMSYDNYNSILNGYEKLSDRVNQISPIYNPEGTEEYLFNNIRDVVKVLGKDTYITNDQNSFVLEVIK